MEGHVGSNEGWKLPLGNIYVGRKMVEHKVCMTERSENYFDSVCLTRLIVVPPVFFEEKFLLFVTCGFYLLSIIIFY